MAHSPILTEFVPLLRQVLTADADPIVRQLAEQGEIESLIEHDVTDNELWALDRIASALSTGNRPPGAEQGFQRLCDALRPHVGKKLLRAAIRCAGRGHQIEIDPETRTIVHLHRGEVPHNQAPNFDPADPSTWLNMHLEWHKTVEDDPEYRNWLETTLFPEDFFDGTSFEASRTLYHVDLQDTLLETAVYRGIPPAPFQKQHLNDAVRNASLELFGHDRATWFHVNVHDNAARFVERFGRYSFDYPLVPIYIMLNYHQALEGGTTYAGIASAHREWVLLFADGFHISVHGPQPFVDRVSTTLNLTEKS